MKHTKIAVLFLALSLTVGICSGLFCNPGPDLLTAEKFDELMTAYSDREHYFDNSLMCAVTTKNPNNIIGLAFNYPRLNFPLNRESEIEYSSVSLIPNKNGTFRMRTSKWHKFNEPFFVNEQDSANIAQVNKALNENCYSDILNGARVKTKILNDLSRYQKQIAFEESPRGLAYKRELFNQGVVFNAAAWLKDELE